MSLIDTYLKFLIFHLCDFYQSALAAPIIFLLLINQLITLKMARHNWPKAKGQVLLFVLFNISSEYLVFLVFYHIKPTNAESSHI